MIPECGPAGSQEVAPDGCRQAWRGPGTTPAHLRHSEPRSVAPSLRLSRLASGGVPVRSGARRPRRLLRPCCGIGGRPLGYPQSSALPPLGSSSPHQRERRPLARRGPPPHPAPSRAPRWHRPTRLQSKESSVCPRRAGSLTPRSVPLSHSTVGCDSTTVRCCDMYATLRTSGTEPRPEARRAHKRIGLPKTIRLGLATVAPGTGFRLLGNHHSVACRLSPCRGVSHAT